MLKPCSVEQHGKNRDDRIITGTEQEALVVDKGVEETVLFSRSWGLSRYLVHSDS